MTTLHKAVQQALEAWKTSSYGTAAHQHAMVMAMTTLHEALVQPPVAPCTHVNVIVEYDYVQCRDCGCVKHDRAGNGWHQSLEHARQFARGKRG